MSTADGTARLRFIGRFVRNPRGVGSLAPSSRWLASAMVAPMAASSAPTASGRPVTVVELGAGTGALTQAIIERIGPRDRLLCVELDRVFVEALRQRWPDVDCACASAEVLRELVADRQLGPVDHIVSGLPFGLMPTPVIKRIVGAIGDTLRPGGTFTTFHYLQSYPLPQGVAFRRRMSARLAAQPRVRLVLRNLPPALSVTWTNRQSRR